MNSSRDASLTIGFWKRPCAFLCSLCVFLLTGTADADEFATPLLASPVQTKTAKSSVDGTHRPEPAALVNPAPDVPMIPVAPIMRNTGPSGTTHELQAQKDLRFRELKRQMEIMSQFVEGGRPIDEPEQSLPDRIQEEKENSSPVVPQRPANSESKKPLIELEKPVPEIPTAEQKPASETHSDHGASTPPQVKLEHDVPGLSEPVPQTSETGSQPVVEGTIDRFALATSLFGAGQVDTCLDVLKYTDLKSLPREDQIWADYMIACCQRRLGMLDQATQTYRKILAEKDSEEIGKLARWWLDDLEEKARLKTDIQRLAETLAAWETEIDQLARQSARTTAQD